MTDASTLLKFGLLLSVLLSVGLAISISGIGPLSAQVQIVLFRVKKIAAFAATALSLASIGWLVYELSSGWDLEVARIVLFSPAGASLAMLASGAFLVLVNKSLAVPGAVLMAMSFGVTGHGPSASWVGMVAAPIHIAAAAWWTGCLVCLLAEARLSGSTQLPTVLRRFSVSAVIMVICLLLAAMGLTASILDPSRLSFRDPYMAMLALKGLAIALALALAIYNRYRLTPRLLLDDSDAIRTFKITVVAELCLIMLAAFQTSLLTTTITPPEFAPSHEHFASYS
jgi:putative copper export protein